MSSLTHQSTTNLFGHGRSPLSDLVGFLVRLQHEWRVRRQVARAQILDGASLRDIGVASSGIESAIRHGRKRGG
jgi:hypothetical protein